jgi:hypothetical protein
MQAPATTPVPMTTPATTPIPTTTPAVIPIPTTTPAVTPIRTQVLVITPAPTQLTVTSLAQTQTDPETTQVLLPPSPSCHALSEKITSRAQLTWTPTHEPSWELGPEHNGYVHKAENYLTGVPGGPKWEELLAEYVIFESLSSSVPVSK